MEKINYSDALLKAMEIVSTSVIEGINYDETIICTIVDDTYAKDGKYTVSNDSVKFDAYSSVISYKVNNVVYVSIPNGDYDNQKFIVGKKISDTEEPFVFTTPFDTIVDLTNNIAKDQKLGGLVANDTVTTSVELFSINDLNLKGFTRFGLQAQFKSWLHELGAVKGSFGIRLTVEDKREDTLGGWAVWQSYLSIDSSDMYGNPYDFEGYFQQEKVFDISSLGTIIGIKCDFYQVPGSFIDRDGRPVKCTDEYGNPFFPNLFAKDVYICAGYDLSDIKDEFVHLVSFDTTTYSGSLSDEANKKTIHLRWVHMEDGKPIVIGKDSNLDYEVRWYHYWLGAASGDSYSGVYWQSIEMTDKKTFSYNTLPDKNKAREQYKVIILYKNQVFRSNIITFNNEKEVISQPTVDSMKALNIHCDDKTYGNYLIYDQGNNLIDTTQSKVVRNLTAFFQSENDTKGENIPLTEARTISWTFPVKNTMIVLDELPVGYEGDTYTITRKSTTPLEDGPIDNSQKYRIKNYYNAQDSNNTVQMSILKDGLVYNTQKEFTFGQAGTTGTDTTLVIDFDNNQTAVTVGDAGATLLTARLYDYENKEVDLKLDGTKLTWEWKWYTQGTGISIVPIAGSPNKVELNTKSLSSINNLYVIQVTVKGWGNYELTAFLPIPLRTDKKYQYVTGANQVIYLSDGTPLYYKKPYVMKETLPAAAHTWKIYPNVPSDISIAEIKNNILIPPKFYIKNNTPYGVKCDEVWMQPVLVIQNRYPSSVVNAWDGKTLTIDHDKGAILATMIAAGSKDSLNRFSGVMLGDWAKNADASLKQTGLYGFHQGAMSFGFKEDGTGFIGKDGKGRILFDGINSTIQSQIYLSSGGSRGMILDFDDGLIKMNNSTSGHITIDSRASTYPFQIGSNFSVAWDGSIYANNGNFTGVIQATGGSISGDLDVTGSLRGGRIEGARIEGGVVIGAEIRGADIIGANIHTLVATSGGSVKPDEYQYYVGGYDPSLKYYSFGNGRYNHEPSIVSSATLEAVRNKKGPVYKLVKGNPGYRPSDGGITFYNTNNVDPSTISIADLQNYKMGKMGIVTGEGQSGSTTNLGIDTASSNGDYGIILESGSNIGIRLKDGSTGGIFISRGRAQTSPGISMTANKIQCTYPAAEQVGFYARFA